MQKVGNTLPLVIDNFLERTVDERRTCQKTHSFFFCFFLCFFFSKHKMWVKPWGTSPVSLSALLITIPRRVLLPSFNTWIVTGWLIYSGKKQKIRIDWNFQLWILFLNSRNRQWPKIVRKVFLRNNWWKRKLTSLLNFQFKLKGKCWVTNELFIDFLKQF